MNEIKKEEQVKRTQAALDMANDATRGYEMYERHTWRMSDEGHRTVVNVATRCANLISECVSNGEPAIDRLRATADAYKRLKVSYSTGKIENDQVAYALDCMLLESMNADIASIDAALVVVDSIITAYESA